MPWVRLHGVKDYLDMIEILDSHPGINQVFNFVPSLLEQLDDYAAGRAVDPHLELSLKKVGELTPDDKVTMLELLFQANFETMIGPNRRYAFLHRTRKTAMDEWTDGEWQDLQVLANLAWIDPLYKAGGRMKELVAKGERYTEDEKREVLEFQREIIKRIVPSLKSHMESGQIEVSVTPYYHPIMPLVYDTSSALIAMPDAELPKYRFRHPEDVERHIKDAVTLYQDLFGRSPIGMWPSEGSVSEEIIPIICKHGFKWMATDEEILAESLGISARQNKPDSLIASGALYRGYQLLKDSASMYLFFRDHALSDNIGFVYSAWDPERAADDLLGKLSAIHRNLLDKRVPNPIVSIILDGENAWEYYKNDGHDFLEILYSKLENSPWLKTCTYEQYVDSAPQFNKLSRLFPGSWISHNFAVWIGHSEDNKAWEMLSKARDDLVAFEEANAQFDKDKLALAWKEIMIAEGSDWCWWFGPDHIGPNNDEFDRLFRSHLANVYQLTGRQPPPELYQPVRTSFMDAHLNRPIDLIRPKIDGRLTHYYEWQQAGFFDCSKAGTTMHRAERILNGIWFGFDELNLYFRLDRNLTVDSRRFERLEFLLEFYDTSTYCLVIRPDKGLACSNGLEVPQVNSKYVDFLEISLPFILLPLTKDIGYVVRISVRERGQLLESWPPAEALRISLPSPQDIPWVI
jgi:alpha-amylase/alpha-mannosidase (GH57 family)